MNVAVCVKQIPDTAVPPALDPQDHTLVREGKLIMDDSDSYGVEMGLQLVEAAGGGEVALVSMAPNSETSGLRTALAMGAAKAVLASDPVLAGSDALGTAKVLAAAIRRLGEPDLVLAGTESTDGYTGTTPSRWPSCSAGRRSPSPSTSRSSDGVLRVQRQTEAGYDEVTCPLPAVVTVTAGVVEPRYPSFKGIMAAEVQARRGGDRRRSRAGPVAGRRRPAPASRSSRSRRPRPARPARSSSTRATPTSA